MPILPPAQFFPPAEQASPEGLLLIGGLLEPAWILDAYSHGIFPWPFDERSPVGWWSPNPRAIIELDGLHVSRRLRRTIRSGKFQVTCDRDFSGVIIGCATSGDRRNATWITSGMISVYTRLFEMGHVHSVETWQDGRLVGGTYGVSIGGIFAAESKFHYVSDASKVALVYLVTHLRSRGYRLLDIQQLTPHTESMGAIEIPRRRYLLRLREALGLPVTFGEQLEGDPGAEQ
jgi:leucyl/phenylalanyl-tRNA--protein transferase